MLTRKNIGNFILCTVALMAIMSAACVYAAWAEHLAPRNPLVPDQLAQIAEVQQRICQLDRPLCDKVEHSSVEYLVVQLPPELDLGKPLHLLHRAEAFANDGGGYRVEISRHVFESGPSALAVFLYHELHHIAFSDLSLYESAAYDQLACVDHNAVKKAAKAFAVEYDRSFPPAGRSAQYYSDLHGNSLQEC